MRNCHGRGAARAGQTMIELLSTMLGGSLLLAGLSLVLGLSLKCCNTGNTPSWLALESHSVLADLAADLQFATAVTEKNTSAVTVTVPDRESDVDSTAETIRYAWSGVPGASLTRQYNNGSAQVVAANVHEFRLQYRELAGKVIHITTRLRLGSNSVSQVDSCVSIINRP